MINSENAFFIYTYVIVTVMAKLDGVITDEENEFIGKVLENHIPKDFDLAEFAASIKSKEVKKSDLLKEAATHLNEDEKKKALTMGLKVAIMDGVIDAKEKKTINFIMKHSDLPEEVYQPILHEVIKGYEKLNAELEEITSEEETLGLKRSFVESH